MPNQSSRVMRSPSAPSPCSSVSVRESPCVRATRPSGSAVPSVSSVVPKIEFSHSCIIPNSTAQQRRMTAKGGFLPPRTMQAKAFWQALMEKHAPPAPLTGPLSLIVIFYYQKKTKTLYKTTKPDLDNLMKMVQDAMQQTGYFVNDSQISILSVGKYYSTDFAGIRLSLEQLQDPEK